MQLFSLELRLCSVSDWTLIKRVKLLLFIDTLLFNSAVESVKQLLFGLMMLIELNLVQIDDYLFAGTEFNHSDISKCIKYHVINLLSKLVSDFIEFLLILHDLWSDLSESLLDQCIFNDYLS